MGEADERSAGPFSDWVDEADHAVVPCDGCTACCRSSYFIHIEPDETAALARIPRALLVPAPGLPKGHVVMGYDQNGRCPMLVDDVCSIYDDRPRTCRRYDCRVFAAAELSPDDDGKTLVAVRVREWRFEHPTARDVREHAAVRAAAVFLRAHPECFPDGALPRREGDLAVAAVHVHRAFLGGEPDVDDVRSALRG